MKKLTLHLMVAASSALFLGCIIDDNSEDDLTLEDGTDPGPADDPGSSGGDGSGAEEDCSNGCFLSGVCQSGASVSACGDGGGACDVCGAGESCDDGTCVAASPSSCSPANCAGCCDGDACLSGTSSAACGSGGDSCVDCGPRGICAEDAFTATCEIDPLSRWNLVALDGELPEKKANGNNWDPFGGLPDGYVRAELDGDQIGKTGNANNTTTPSWNQAVATDVRAGDIENMVLEIKDADFDDLPDDLVGRCGLPRLSFNAYGAVLALTCRNGAGWKLRLAVEPN